MTGSRVSSVTQAAVVRVTLLMVVLIVLLQSVQAAPGGQMDFQRIPLQFIAAFGAPDATTGNNAQDWGVWPVDPGPRGVRLNRFDRLQQADGVAPAGWQFDTTDWWLEENGLLMEQPEFPLLPGQYLVTGDRKVTTVLTVHPVDAQGNARWELADEATLYDVTHLGCRSARYTPTTDKTMACTPANAPQDAFRVAAGAEMPPIAGCMKQDYAVLFIVGVAVEE
jgi:hypothetical protein